MHVNILQNQNQKKAVATVIYNEFVIKQCSQVTFNRFLKFLLKTNKNSFQYILVTLSNRKDYIGTVSIFEHSLKNNKILLASLYVDSYYRNNVGGNNRISKLLMVAKKIGYKEIYLTPKQTLFLWSGFG